MHFLEGSRAFFFADKHLILGCIANLVAFFALIAHSSVYLGQNASKIRAIASIILVSIDFGRPRIERDILDPMPRFLDGNP